MELSIRTPTPKNIYRVTNSTNVIPMNLSNITKFLRVVFPSGTKSRRKCWAGYVACMSSFRTRMEEGKV